MALFLKHEEVRACVDIAGAIEAMESVFAEEGAGQTLLPQRINMKAGKGWLRVGPVALERSGWAGFKAMNLAPGQGVRYQVHLYRIETGELVAIMDAQYLTTLRTGATSAVATRRLAPPGPRNVALLGSGAEARAQLDAMQSLGIVRKATVFSPTAANRERLAEDFRRSHGMEIVATASAEEAVAESEIILAAVKSSEPVLFGEWLNPGSHVNSVGTARRDQREIDEVVFQRSSRIVVDTREGVFGEAGDAVAAKAVIDADRVQTLSELVAGTVAARSSDDEITLFKSVGTGLQDIALASAIYEAARRDGIGTDLGDFPYLKN